MVMTCGPDEIHEAGSTTPLWINDMLNLPSQSKKGQASKPVPFMLSKICEQSAFAAFNTRHFSLDTQYALSPPGYVLPTETWKDRFLPARSRSSWQWVCKSVLPQCSYKLAE